MLRTTPAEYDALARSDCFVCRLVAGRPLVPNPRVVFEDAHVVAFLNQFPSQEGYTLVCPKRHVERFQSELSDEEWRHLQNVVRAVARAVAEATGAIRMYIASLGSPERNPHLHVHVCPCPPNTPFEQQQLAAMMAPSGEYLVLDAERLDKLASAIQRPLGVMRS